LDDFLKLSGRELLSHAGTVSHEQALARAQLEYEKHRTWRINQRSPVEQH
ncbi:MAG TPA: cell filamentation protein Fic, partial [Firmicutes bacterium]|nr:cell filamentation protein Fic [Bacillota bacterium]